MSILRRTISRRTLLKTSVPGALVFSRVLVGNTMAVRARVHSIDTVGYGEGGYGQNAYPASDDDDDLYLPFVTRRGS